MERHEQLLMEIRDLLKTSIDEQRELERRRDAQVEASLDMQRAHRRLTRVILLFLLVALLFVVAAYSMRWWY